MTMQAKCKHGIEGRYLCDECFLESKDSIKEEKSVAFCSECKSNFTVWISDSLQCPECEGRMVFADNRHIKKTTPLQVKCCCEKEVVCKLGLLGCKDEHSEEETHSCCGLCGAPGMHDKLHKCSEEGLREREEYIHEKREGKRAKFLRENPNHKCVSCPCGCPIDIVTTPTWQERFDELVHDLDRHIPKVYIAPATSEIKSFISSEKLISEQGMLERAMAEIRQIKKITDAQDCVCLPQEPLCQNCIDEIYNDGIESVLQILSTLEKDK